MRSLLRLLLDLIHFRFGLRARCWPREVHRDHIRTHVVERDGFHYIEPK